MKKREVIDRLVHELEWRGPGTSTEVLRDIIERAYKAGVNAGYNMGKEAAYNGN